MFGFYNKFQGRVFVGSLRARRIVHVGIRTDKKRMNYKLGQVNEAVVVAAGPGRRDDSGKLVPMEVKEGDTVLLPDYGGHSLKLDGKE